MDDIIKIVAGTSLPLGFVCFGVLAYVNSYLKKKAENLATHEDIQTLVEQTAKITKAAEGIKADLLQVTWEKQQRSTKRCEFYGEVVVAIGNCLDLLKKASGEKDEADALGDYCVSTKKWDEFDIVRTDFLRLMIVARLIATHRALDLLSQIRRAINAVGQDLDSDAVIKAMSLMRQFCEVARADLEY